MNKPIRIVTGRKYVDIDGYASMIAYRELLRAQGCRDVSASTPEKFNRSVPKMILDLKYHLDDYSVDSEANYIELDVSRPDFFDKRVTEDNLVEIIDHHVGYEEYWRKRPKVKSQIEFIGSVCTMIYERIIESKHEEILDTDLCKLLIAGILDNTLNMKSDITSDRDRVAYSELMRIGGISDDYCVEYFSACEAEIVGDLAQAIRDDIKIEKVGVLPEVIGQMVLLSARKFDRNVSAAVFAEYSEWMMNVISLEDGKSYIYFNGDGVRERLEGLFGARCESEGLLVLDKFMLRKEIMKRATDLA